MPSYTDGQARPAGGGYGEPALAVREAIAADLSGGVDGNYTPLQVDATGNLRVTGTFGAGSSTIGATQDAGPAQTCSFGVTGAAVASADLTTAAAVTDAPASGKKLVILDFLVATDTAMRFDFQEETTNTVVLSLYLSANSSQQITPRGKIKLATANKRLFGKASATGNVRVTPVYYSET